MTMLRVVYIHGSLLSLTVGGGGGREEGRIRTCTAAQLTYLLVVMACFSLSPSLHASVWFKVYLSAPPVPSFMCALVY